MAWGRVQWRACSFLCSVSLFAQAPSPESFHIGELTKAVRTGDGSHEYTIYNGADDAFTGATTVEIRVREGTQVKYTISNGSIYIIDDDGKIQQTNYVRQAEMVRITIPGEDLRKLMDDRNPDVQPVRSEIPRALDLKAPDPIAAPAPEPKPDTKKAGPKKKAKPTPQKSN